MSDNAIVCVMGMHRSGTSLATRLLNVIGVHLGPPQHLMEPNQFNPKGFWEHQLMVDINDAVLALAGGTWSEPPRLTQSWELQPSLHPLRQRATGLIEADFGDHRRWGWKDPRNCLTLPFWRTLVSPSHYVICVRNPADVELSLRREHGFTTDTAQQLWARYSASAIRHTMGERRLFVSYEHMVRDQKATVDRLTGFVGISPTGGAAAAESEPVADESLHHYKTSVSDLMARADISAEIKELFMALHALAAEPQPEQLPDALNDRALLQLADQADSVGIAFPVASATVHSGRAEGRR